MIECPVCNGEGGREVTTRMERDGSPGGYWETCHACEGKREVEIDVEPVTLEDVAAPREG